MGTISPHQFNFFITTHSLIGVSHLGNGENAKELDYVTDDLDGNQVIVEAKPIKNRTGTQLMEVCQVFEAIEMHEFMEDELIDPLKVWGL
jgi:hypothetical protein